MKRGHRASRVIEIACPGRGAPPDERYAGEFCPEWAAAAASAW